MYMLSAAVWLLCNSLFFSLRLAGNPGSFPRPLSAAEEKAYLERFAAGDLEARNVLIEHNLRLVAHISGKFRSSGLESDDLISIGTIGLIKAVQTFSPVPGAALATYAAKCIENEILMVLRAGKKRRNEVSLQEPVGTDKEGNEITLIEILGTEAGEVEDEVSRRMNALRVRQLVTTELTPRERLVIEMRYGLDGRAPRAQREVAQMMGISRSYVSRIEKLAVEKLAEAYARE